eukprot:CAMPEP_0185729412 /NCGR_PEP_ID=MMETSP1171-20130828/5701_1 /TAXON_ID=374046 /ORGANISM="Helicotheca tamensis, Strain CCMP826" /LENGTH=411 /DNA_ID=CAMNT_0028398245 /DNA_START=8 /DNA_END=1243 /DNA_ORIENTATION=+
MSTGATIVSSSCRRRCFSSPNGVLPSFILSRQEQQQSDKVIPSVKAVTATYSSSSPKYFSSLKTSSSSSNNSNSNIVVFPPNLKIDPRSKSSPFYGLERIQKEESDDVKKDEPLDAQHVEADEADEEPNDADADTDNDNEEEEEAAAAAEDLLYDLSKQQEAYHAIPLPQRLHNIPIHHLQSSTTSGTINLHPSIFAMDPIRIDILCRVVNYQRNKKRGKRNAAAITKTISQVRGSGRKVRQQKGSGMARAGHSRPAHWRGGAKAHGPKGKVQDYTTKLTKKVRKLGLKHVLSQKLKEGNFFLVNDWNVESYKTKALGHLLYQNFAVGGRGGATAFLIDAPPSSHPHQLEEDEGTDMYVGGVNVNLKVASGNLTKVKVCNQLGCNVYDVLKHEKLIMSLEALKALEARLLA